VLLARGLDITVETNPVLLYSCIALANGCYISGHNWFRGLPRGAIVGNFFRTVLSIPLAIAMSALVTQALRAQGFSAVAAAALLQPWATVISKLSSDTVAAVIEGVADRAANLWQRMIDLNDKQQLVLDVYSRLEVLFPEADVRTLLTHPKRLVQEVKAQGADLIREMIVNALDLMYFWMLQPRGRTAFQRFVREASRAEVEILLRSQLILERKKGISSLLIDGLVGKQFDQALAFYLSRADAYLADLKRLGGDLMAPPGEVHELRPTAAPPGEPARPGTDGGEGDDDLGWRENTGVGR
jgi:hypothetical protein